MRISATGANSRRAAGFSLIELLVVVVIVGVLVSAVTLATGGSASRQLETAAQRAQRLIQLACERAEATGVDMGFAIGTRGLRFGYLRGEAWLPIDERAAEELRERPLAAAVELTARRDGDILLDGDSATQPQLLCSSAGELTPFELDLSHPGVAERWRLSGAPDGRLELARIDDAG